MIVGVLILALFASCLVAMLYDIDCLIEEVQLDDLWGVDEELVLDPRWSAEA